MKIVNKQTANNFILRGFFTENKIKEKNILVTKNSITEYVDKKIAYICLGSKKEFNLEELKITIQKIINLNTRNFLIDPSTFTNDILNKQLVISKFVDIYEYNHGEDLYSAKTNKKEKLVELSLFVDDSKDKKMIENVLAIAKLVNNARRLQAMPPNICNSEWLAKDIESLFKKELDNNKLKIRILNKKQIEKENMGLFLSVNKGSVFEPRLVVVEYNGNPKSKDKIALIGKGITFDSGGYNLKGSQHIQEMKFDMSGAAICASALKGVISLSTKVNAVAVLPLTDNKISSSAQTPDSVWYAMNGKSVEINNTDAEGRLILADAITYAIKKLNVTEIIDVATLTGAIIVSLGTTYTGVWATDDQLWNEFLLSANQQDELVWRMPFHNDFLKNIKLSKVADYKNTDLSGKGGSNSAAMFLKEFVEDRKYLHLDIAGSAGTGDNPTGIMTKTLIQFLINKGNK